MKKIAIFCIPAHGHTNPILPVAKELVKRGNSVRFYSFSEFADKIRATGAEYIECDRFRGELTEKEEQGLKKVSATEMSIQAIRITLNMNDFVEKEFSEFKPDVIYTDSVCFWGKLNAWKHHIPMVVSTSTFAFNQMSSGYMKNSAGEIADMVFGLGKIGKELKKLKPYGYEVKNMLALIQSDNQTDSVVYTSRRFQPCAESFSDHYLFAGPSVFSEAVPMKDKQRPLVYISMGTVINDRPEFYRNCIAALKDENVDVIISCGTAVDIGSLGELPDNISVYPYVDQLDILSRADAFITHCGMNSVSESLYMATPMALYPQTNEQKAVARRVEEIGAGVMLENDTAEGIRATVKAILGNRKYSDAALECSNDFRACPGPEGTAEFIENAPHTSNGVDVLAEVNKTQRIFSKSFSAGIGVTVILMCIFGVGRYAWIVGVGGGILSPIIGKKLQKKKYESIVEKMKK